MLPHNEEFDERMEELDREILEDIKHWPVDYVHAGEVTGQHRYPGDEADYSDDENEVFELARQQYRNSLPAGERLRAIIASSYMELFELIGLITAMRGLISSSDEVQQAMLHFQHLEEGLNAAFKPTDEALIGYWEAKIRHGLKSLSQIDDDTGGRTD